MKKLVSIVLALAMIMMVAAASAASLTLTRGDNYDPNNIEHNTNKYYAYKIFDATKAASGTGISYFVKSDNPFKATLEATGKFAFTAAADGSGWTIALADGVANDEATAKAIASAVKAAIDGGLTLTGDYAAQELTPGTALSVDEGYYLIVSELGENLVLATTDVNIQEKNDYPGVTKTVAPEDATAQIGDTINYTLTVSVPEGANQEIVLTDTMTEGLTFKQIVSVKEGDNDVAYTASAVDTTTNSFTITFTAETVTANQTKTITILYEATLNEKAVVETPDVNTVKLNYGNKYESKPEHVDTDTNKFAVLKYNGADTEKNPLAGATFQLRIGTTVVKLIKVNDTTYRVANGDETGAVETFTTVATEKVTIYGVDKDVAYNILETEAPAGFNKLKDPFGITVEADNSLIAEVPNNTGTTLPSTGGIGTTIFYILGGVLIVGAAIILVARRKAHD